MKLSRLAVAAIAVAGLSGMAMTWPTSYGRDQASARAFQPVSALLDASANLDRQYPVDRDSEAYRAKGKHLTILIERLQQGENVRTSDFDRALVR